MRDIPTKSDNVGDTLPASDFNANLRNELQTVVTSAGYSLDPTGGPDTDVEMLSKAVSAYSHSSASYQDSGAINAYVLTGLASFKKVDSYPDGMTALFKIGNANTGASTVNINAIGVKNITQSDGTPLVTGDLVLNNYAFIQYKLSNDRFELALSNFDPNTLNLGTASNADLTTSSVDTTTGRVLKVGAESPQLSLGNAADATLTTSSADATAGRVLQVGAESSQLSLGNAADADLTTSSVDTTPGRVLKVGAESPQLNLGTAADADLTTSTTDATLGRALKVGDFGLGHNLATDITDLDTLLINGIYGVNSSAPNKPSSGFGNLFVTNYGDATTVRCVQVFLETSGQHIYSRLSTGTWSPWRELFHQGNIIGSVSQVGGIPTGAIIEQGSNANGDYVKYADGTMVCWFTDTGLQTCDTVEGNVFRSTGVTLTFPVAFVGELPIIAPTLVSQVNYPWAIMISPPSLTTALIAMHSATNTATGYPGYIARGRWY